MRSWGWWIEQEVICNPTLKDVDNGEARKR